MNTNIHYYKVAELPFAITLPNGWDTKQHLSNFERFEIDEVPTSDLIFHIAYEDEAPCAIDPQAAFITDTSFDGGTARLYDEAGAYLLEMQYSEGAPIHHLHFDKACTQAQLRLNLDDSHAAFMLNSIVRVFFAQACLYHQAVSIHSSTISYEGKGYLFMGKSGTGKSTHTVQWRKAFGAGVQLLNDDNPIVRLHADGSLIVYGSPWSGKLPCYKNEHYPVEALVRLKQAPHNTFHPLKGIDAFTVVFPGCSCMRSDKQQMNQLYATLSSIVSQAKVGLMECLPTPDAAISCHAALQTM